MDRVVHIIQNEEATPELPHLVAAAIMTLQALQEGSFDMSSENFEWMQDCVATGASLTEAVGTIWSFSTNYRFNHEQTVRLAQFLLERFGRPMQDPSRFIAMGGMPADDDDDVVLVRDEISPVEDAKKKVSDAKKKVDEAVKDFKSKDKKAIKQSALHVQSLNDLFKAKEALEKAKEDHDKAEKLRNKRWKKVKISYKVAKKADEAQEPAKKELARLKKEEADKKAQERANKKARKD